MRRDNGSGDSAELGLDRRTVLKGIGVSSAAGIVGLPALSGQAAADHVDITGGLVAHYPLDETSGAVEDVSGNNDGTNNGAMRGVVGPDNEAFEFDGSNEFVQVPHDASLNFERSDSFSIATWVNFDEIGSSTNEVLVAKRENSGANPGYILWKDTSDQIQMQLQHSSSNRLRVQTDTAGLNNTDFFHIVVTYDGSSNPSGIDIYIDGQSKNHSTIDNSLSDSITHTDPLRLARQHSNLALDFNGILDDVRIYNSVLSQNDIEQLATRLIIVDETIAEADENEFRKNTIQEGVDAAEPGDTVRVRDGTYEEQVVINKDLTLESAPGDSPTIQAPNSPDSFTIAESGRTWFPVVFAFGGSESGSDPRDVSGSGTVDVSISGFTIDGDGKIPSGFDRTAGVFLRNVTNEVTDNTIENMGVGDGQTTGITVYGDSDVTISDNEVKDYSRLGIFVTGDAGTGVPDPDASLHRNTVMGHANDSAAVPLGIQLSFGATGEIQHNTVKDNKAPEGEGVVIVDSEDVPVTKNTIENNETSVVIGSVNVFGLTPHLKAENNKIKNNDISGIPAGKGNRLEQGVFLWSAEEDGSVDNTKVVNNDISKHEDGVVITTPGNGATAENVKIIRNRFSDINDNIDTDGATETKVHANA